MVVQKEQDVPSFWGLGWHLAFAACCRAFSAALAIVHDGWIGKKRMRDCQTPTKHCDWFNTITMAPGKVIPETIQWIVVRLSTRLSIEEICMYVDISKRSVEKIMAHFR
jgi:hypothetical protein